MHSFTRFSIACLIGTIATAALADWPAFRGPNGDGISSEKMLASWPADGPKVLWKAPVAEGLGSIAVVGDKAYFLGAEGENESCYAIELKTGKPLWSTQLDITKKRPGGQGGPGPGSGPAVADDKVYTYSSQLKLACLNAADGKVVWKHDIQSEFNGELTSAGAIKNWGNTCSPIIEGDLVIVPGGGPNQSALAFDKATGTLAWKGQSQTLTHATPTPATIDGVRQIIFFTQSGLLSLEPKTGKLLWKQPYKPATAIAASPVVEGDIVYCSIGYGVGGAAFKLTKAGENFTAKQLWHVPKQNMNQWSTPVCKDGYLYQVTGHGGNNLPLQCVELTTGKVMWSGPAVGPGEILLVDGKLIVQSATGKLLLVDPNPQAYKEISTAQPLAGQAWGWPAFSDGVFIYRTNKEASAIDLSVK